MKFFTNLMNFVGQDLKLCLIFLHTFHLSQLGECPLSGLHSLKAQTKCKGPLHIPPNLLLDWTLSSICTRARPSPLHVKRFNLELLIMWALTVRKELLCSQDPFARGLLHQSKENPNRVFSPEFLRFHQKVGLTLASCWN